MTNAEKKTSRKKEGSNVRIFSVHNYHCFVGRGAASANATLGLPSISHLPPWLRLLSISRGHCRCFGGGSIASPPGAGICRRYILIHSSAAVQGYSQYRARNTIQVGFPRVGAPGRALYRRNSQGF